MIENINDFISLGVMSAIVLGLLAIIASGFAQEHHIKRYEKEVEYYQEFYEEDDDEE